MSFKIPSMLPIDTSFDQQLTWDHRHKYTVLCIKAICDGMYILIDCAVKPTQIRFLQRNISHCPSNIESSVSYQSFVRPTYLNIAAPVWSPHTRYNMVRNNKVLLVKLKPIVMLLNLPIMLLNSAPKLRLLH